MTRESRAKIIVFLVIGAALLSLVPVIWNANAGFYKMPIPSMYPTLKVGDHIMASAIRGKIQRGDLVIFRYPVDQTKIYIKRAVGIGGDTVALHEGRLIINGNSIDQQQTAEPCESDCAIWMETVGSVSYRIALGKKAPPVAPNGRDYGPEKVPDNTIFVLGDNRDNSADSRYWGFVPLDLTTGKPTYIYWSSGENGVDWSRLFHKIR